MSDNAVITSNLVNGNLFSSSVVQGTSVFSSVTTGGIGPTGPGIAAGGTVGQFLVKTGPNISDTAWQDLPQITPNSLILYDANSVPWVFTINTSGQLVTSSSSATNTLGNVFGVLTLS